MGAGSLIGSSPGQPPAPTPEQARAATRLIELFNEFDLEAAGALYEKTSIGTEEWFQWLRARVGTCTNGRPMVVRGERVRYRYSCEHGELEAEFQINPDTGKIPNLVMGARAVDLADPVREAAEAVMRLYDAWDPALFLGTFNEKFEMEGIRRFLLDVRAEHGDCSLGKPDLVSGDLVRPPCSCGVTRRASAATRVALRAKRRSRTAGGRGGRGRTSRRRPGRRGRGRGAARAAPVLTPASATCYLAAMSDMTILASPTALLGYGYDADTGDRKQLAFKHEPAGDIKPVRPTEFGGTANWVDTHQSMSNAFSFGTSLKYSWAFGGMDGRVRLLNSVETSSHTLTACFYARIQTSPRVITERLDKSSLSIDARRLMRSKPHAFTEAYGTHFIKEICMGGEFYATLSFAVDDTKQREDLRASLKIDAFSGSLDMAAVKETQRQLSRLGVNLMLWTTNDPNSVFPVTFEELLDRWRNFGETVKSAPGMIGVTLGEYSEIAPEDAIDPKRLQTRSNHMKALLDFFATFKSYAAELDEALKKPAWYFPFHDRAALMEMREKCHQGIERVIEAIGRVKRLEVLENISDFAPDESLCVQFALHMQPLIPVEAANPVWTNTGIDVRPGDRLEFSTPPGQDNRWTISRPTWGWTDAAGYPNLTNTEGHGPRVPRFNFGRLIGLIGDEAGGEFVDVGLGTTHVARSAGRVRLICNDSNTHPVGYRDNEGVINVRIKHVQELK